MSSVMEIAMKEMGQLIELATANLKVLPGPIVNVSGYGAVGDGVTNDTTTVQSAIDYAIAHGMKAVFFPRGTNGQYYVNTLINANQVVLFGDNASFVGGYSGTILQLGEGGVTQAVIDALKAETVTGIVNLATGGFGAVGNGVVDDYQAIVDAIAACGVGGVLFIPEPSVTYRVSQKIVISAPIRIVGTHFKVSTSENPTITFDAGALTGFESTSTDVTIEKLAIKTNSTSGSFVAAIHLNSPDPSGNANTQLRDLFIYMNHTAGAGVKGRNVITSEFHNVRTFQGAYGFYFDTAGTSLKFDSCWAMSCTATGYYVSTYEYIDFINCACDSPNNPNYGYHIANCNGVSFNACGAEGLGKTMFRFEGGNGYSVNGCRAIAMNQAGTGVASFSEQTDASNVNYIGCMESGQAGSLPSVSATGNFYPIVMNCNFSKVTMDTSSYTATAFEVRGMLRLGGLAIAISPFASELTIAKNHDLAFSERRVGVLKADASGWHGYIENDGTIVARSFTALPVAEAAHRGKIARVEGGAGVADHIYLCIKNAADAYVWQQII